MEQEKNTSVSQEMMAVTIGVLLIGAVMLYFGFRASSDDESDSSASIGIDGSEKTTLPLISIGEAKKRFFANSTTFIDIRPKEAYDVSHIPESISAPVVTLSEYQPKDNDSVLIAWSASDLQGAETAYRLFKEKAIPYGFLDGGIEAWGVDGGTLITYGYQNSFIDQSKVTLLSAPEFKPYIDEELVPSYIIDVRKKELYDRGHIKNAVNIPLSELERRFRDIPPATNIAAYGETEIESFQAAVRLFDLNFWSVRTLKDGFGEWEKAGYPITK